MNAERRNVKNMQGSKGAEEQGCGSGGVKEWGSEGVGEWHYDFPTPLLPYSLAPLLPCSPASLTVGLLKPFIVHHSSFIVSLVILCLAVTFSACKSKPSIAVIGVPRGHDTVMKMVQEKLGSGEQPGVLEIKFDQTPIISNFPAGIEGDVKIARHLAGIPNLIGVVGHSDSRSSIMVAPIYNEAEVPQIVPTATSSRLEEAGPWTFRMAPDESVQGAFIASFAASRLRARSATIFYHIDEYGTGLRDSLIASLGERGIAVLDLVPFDWIYRPLPGQLPEQDFEAIVSASVRRARPDVVIIAGRSQEAGTIGRFMHELLPDARLIASDGVEVMELFLKNAGESADSFHTVAFWHPDSPDEVSREFVERFNRAFGRHPGPAEAMNYDAIMLLAEAARQVGPNRALLRRYLGELGVVRPPYRGVTGMISFTPDRPARLIMTRVSEGKAFTVETR